MKIIKKFFGALGYKLVDKGYVKSLRIIDQYLSSPEKIITKLIKEKKIKKIIQVGSNDGIRDDFLRKCLNKNLEIIFIEPIPSAFKRLKYNYRNFKKSIFLNNAVDTKKLKKKIFSIDPSCSKYYDNFYRDGDEEFLSILASFDKNHLIKHGIKDNHIISKDIQTVTFKEILSNYSYFDIDLLVIDTEGYDAILVLNFLRTVKARPVIIFESVHIPNKYLEITLKNLKKNNYEIIKTQKDFLCLNEKFLKKF